MASKAHVRLTNKKQTSARAKARNAKPPEQTAIEHGKSPSSASLDVAREKLRLACEQIGFALAAARQSEDFDAVDSLTPILASVWSARMELGDVPEVKP